MAQRMTLEAFGQALEAGPYAWPGGYPLYFIMDDGGALSFAAAVANRETIEDSIAEDIRDGWRPLCIDVNWENPDLYCDHTGERIESAYAEPDENHTLY